LTFSLNIKWVASTHDGLSCINFGADCIV